MQAPPVYREILKSKHDKSLSLYF